MSSRHVPVDVLSEQDLRRVAAEAAADVRTVAKAYTGGVVQAGPLARIKAAAQRLGVRLPGEPAGA